MQKHVIFIHHFIFIHGQTTFLGLVCYAPHQDSQAVASVDNAMTLGRMLLHPVKQRHADNLPDVGVVNDAVLPVAQVLVAE